MDSWTIMDPKPETLHRRVLRTQAMATRGLRWQLALQVLRSGQAGAPRIARFLN